MPGPVLKDLRGTKTISLPGYENSEVVIYDGILIDSFSKVQKLLGATPETMDVASLKEALVLMIASWNFVDAQDKPIPVSAEAMSLLNIDALTFLVSEIAATINDKKKDTQS